MATTPAKEVVKQVRPLLSSNTEEVKRRVRNLYKRWCRAIQFMNIEYNLPLSFEEASQRIKSEFMKHKDIKDIRVIDMLIIKSEAELSDITKKYRFLCQFYYKIKLNPPQENKDFLSKFISGKE